jgi:drug/metabolite transporter (DMT)-like permease
VGVWNGLGATTWLGIGACLLAVVGYGISYPYVRRHLATGGGELRPLTFATGLMVMGTLQIAPVAAITGFSHAGITPSVVLAMLALGCLGSGLAYVLNFLVISRSDATTASTVTYVITLVAVVSGALVLGEHITWNEPVGAALVLLGAAVAQGLLPLRALSPTAR